MDVIVKKIAGPQTYNWEDIHGACAAQSVIDPTNIVLKVTNNIAVRLTNCPHGAKGSVQNPGPTSLWYKCHISVEVTPAIGVKNG